MLLDAIASIVLAGMMLIPLANIFVGVIVGASLGGVPGALAGFVLAAAVIAAEKSLGDRRGWFDLKCVDNAMPIERMPLGQEMHGEHLGKRLRAMKRRPRGAHNKRQRRPRMPIPESRALH